MVHLSEIEQKVYDYIKQNGKASVEAICNDLGTKATGAVGRLLKNSLIYKRKIRPENQYKMKSYYFLQEENNE